MTLPERRSQWVYVWLLLSSFVTVPAMLVGLLIAEGYQADERLRPSQAEIHTDARGVRGTEPSWSPDGTRIAFASDREGRDSIYVVRLDGRELTRVIHSPQTDYDPAWSLNGESIAFSSDRDGDFDIYVARSDGSAVEQITDDPGNDENPTWSPDGEQIAFYSDRDGNREIYVVDRDGGHPRNLTMHPGQDWPAAWSPDGGRIAFGSDRGGDWEIYVMSADGSNARPLIYEPGDDLWPAWSPDGQWIAFSSERHGNREIYKMTSNGSFLTNLSDDSHGDGMPAWSPDGARIAFVSDRRDGIERLYVMNADGLEERPIIHLPPPEPVAAGISADAWFFVAGAAPGLIHLLLLAGWASPHLYLRRHSQQGAGLAAIRIFSATTILGLMGSEGVALWALVNGSLWLFGGIWGLRQVGRGDSWLMRRLGEDALLPAPSAAAGEAADAPQAARTPTAIPSADLQAPTAALFAGPSRPEVLIGGTMNSTSASRHSSSEDLAHGQVVIVTARWILVFAGLVLALWNSTDVAQLRVQILFILGLAFANFYLHAQILMRKPAIRSVIYAASAADLTVISVNVLAGGGFDSQTFAFYFPALLVLSVAFPAAMTALYTGATVSFYSLIGLAAAAFDDADLQTVVIRDLMLVAVAVCGALYLRMETRRREETLPGEPQATPQSEQERQPGKTRTKRTR